MSAVAPVAAPQPAVRRAWSREPRDLETRLVAEARAPSALRRALARVADRMVAVRGWERLGFARSGDYAVERAGISGRELRDLAAVGGALARLPVLDAAFRTGEIGWTQVRLLCRVATTERRALAQGWRSRSPLVRSRARCAWWIGARASRSTQRAVLRVTPRARARWWSARQVANRVAGHALSNSAFAEVLAAKVLSAVPIESSASEEPCLRRAGEAEGTPGAEGGSRLPRLPAMVPFPTDPNVAALERDLESADAFELDRRLQRAVRMEARGHARVAALLCDVVSWGLHRNLGFRSVDAYAEERLGMAPSRARALLRFERAARVCAPLRADFAEGRIWVQAHALVPLFLEPRAARYRGDWIAHTQRVTARRLGDDVERALTLGEFTPPALAATLEQRDAERDPAGLQTGADARLEKESERLLFSAVPEVVQLFRAVLATVQRRLERIRRRPCRPSDALEAMLDLALATWRANERTRRDYRVFERDGWRCTAPGCTSYRNLHRHHIVFRSHRGSNQDSNLTTLCAWHHERGVHRHVLRCTGIAPDGLRFELGLRSDAPPLAVYRSGEVRVGMG